MNATTTTKNNKCKNIYKSSNGLNISLEMSNTQETFTPNLIIRCESDLISDICQETNKKEMTNNQIKEFVFDAINTQIKRINKEAVTLDYNNYSMNATIRVNQRNIGTNEKAIATLKALREAPTTPIEAKPDTNDLNLNSDLIAYISKHIKNKVTYKDIESNLVKSLINLKATDLKLYKIKLQLISDNINYVMQQENLKELSADIPTF